MTMSPAAGRNVWIGECGHVDLQFGFGIRQLPILWRPCRGFRSEPQPGSGRPRAARPQRCRQVNADACPRHPGQTDGKVSWNGVDIATNPDALRVSLGYLPQDFGVYTALSAREFLNFLAAVKGLSGTTARDRVEHCLELVGLHDVADQRLGGYSGGMRQRIGIAQALLNDPTVLIVDEPTVGLDPEERMRFRHLLTDLAGARLVILSTHIVSDVEASATELAIMAKGRLRFHGTPEALIAQADGHVWEWTVDANALADVRTKYTLCASLRRPDGIRVRVVHGEQPHADAQRVEPTLEDAYTWLLGREALH
jgi:ABC-type multidrug transport system ATPase subunit